MHSSRVRWPVVLALSLAAAALVFGAAVARRDGGGGGDGDGDETLLRVLQRRIREVDGRSARGGGNEQWRHDVHA